MPGTVPQEKEEDTVADKSEELMRYSSHMKGAGHETQRDWGGGGGGRKGSEGFIVLGYWT